MFKVMLKSLLKLLNIKINFPHPHFEVFNIMWKSGKIIISLKNKVILRI